MNDRGVDSQLLRRFVAERDDAAFAKVVSRYLDLVYSAAARRVGSAALADDVTQAVFIVLARKAKSAASAAPLSGWLLRTTRYCAQNAMKLEARRRRHEQAAAKLANHSAGACSANPSDVLIWQELAGQIDDAVLKLSDHDRQAVLLRFYEDRPTRDIAQALNISEDAAKQRVSRAVEKLRIRLERRGASVDLIGAAGFTTLLTTNLSKAAPAALIHASCALATSAGAAASAITIAKGAITMMTWTNTKAAAAIIAGVMLAGAGGVISVRHVVAQTMPAEHTTTLPTEAGEPSQTEYSLDQLKTRLDDLKKQLIAKRAEIRRNDPLVREAEIRLDDMRSHDNGAFHWVVAQAKTHPDTNEKYYRLNALYTLATVLEIMDKPHGDKFIEAALLDKTSRFQSKDDLANEVARALPGVNRQGLGDPAQLWKTLESQAPELRQKVEQEIADLPKTLDWPEQKVSDLGSDQSDTTNVAVLMAFAEAQYWKGTGPIITEMRTLDKQIKAIEGSSKKEKSS